MARPKAGSVAGGFGGAAAAIAAARKSEIAKIKIGAKDLRLDDDTYRDLLQRLTGRRSAADLSPAQRGAVLDHMASQGAFKGRSKSVPTRPHIGKIRALWISLWNLAAIDDGGDAALNAFVCRQTGVERVDWLQSDQSGSVIEALKVIAARYEWHVPADGREAKVALIDTQWNWLLALGEPVAMRIAEWEERKGSFSDQELDVAAGKLGAWIRAAKAGGEAASR
ncbi:MAG: DUF1018 domain-containing protein [Rhizobiales bacterium]|nr:DUF1018 domain-containing protein [Hyphomicrobiales bacterium]